MKLYNAVVLTLGLRQMREILIVLEKSKYEKFPPSEVAIS